MNTKKYSLVLRACNADMSSKNDFIWPTSGLVEAPDWEPTNDYGNGLHGWLHGHGDGEASNYWSNDCKWLVIKVKNKHIIDLEDKVKFKKGTVVFCRDRKGATDYILDNDPIAPTKPVIGAMITTGDHSTSISGDFGTSISGNFGTSISSVWGTSISGDFGTSISGDNGTSSSSYKGTSTSGDYGTATSGHKGTSTSGDHGTSTSGEYGTATSGYHGSSTSGDYGTSSSGHYGTSTSGDHGTSSSGAHSTSTSGAHGTSTSGDYGTSTSGHQGTSTSGQRGKATSGEDGTIIIKYWKNGRYYSKVGHIGEDGLEPNVAYKLDEKHNFIEVIA